MTDRSHQASQPAARSAAPRLSAWTPERVARALRLYLREGFTASEVAGVLGAGFTRGAVIGKIRRLGFFKRERCCAGAAAPSPREPRRPCSPPC